ncbi:MAG TPA: hypothetical protein PLX71_01225 [Phycicoccus sp.]|nr:hypothetical protein [Phycicoccus sp.]
MPATPPELFATLIDDAAVFPPGRAPLPLALTRHTRHRGAPYAATIGPLLLPTDLIEPLTGLVPRAGVRPVRVGLIARPGTDPAAVTAAMTLAGSHPGTEIVSVDIGWQPGWQDLSLGVPMAVEIPRGDDQQRAFDEVAAAAARGAGVVGKFRTGPTPEWSWPDEAELAAVILGFVRRETPFKLTGGLHHAIRGTYSPEGTPEENHGVVNVLLAVDCALHAKGAALLRAVLADRDSRALSDAVSNWGAPRAAKVRRALTSFGCCDVTDPLTELTHLGLLPSDHRPKDAR